MTEEDIEKIEVEDKDSQNTKRSTKVAKEMFAVNVKEKKLREPEVFLMLGCGYMAGNRSRFSKR